MILLLTCIACDNVDYSIEKQLYNDYSEVAYFEQSGSFDEAINATKQMRVIDPESRALLEKLLYLYLQSNQEQEGLQIAGQYLEVHPGDFEIRLVRSKLLLQANQEQFAIQDLQVLLHNKKLHPWEISSDKFYRKYLHKPEMKEFIDFELIRLTHKVFPSSALVGDNIIVELHFIHLNSCQLSIPQQSITSLVQLERLHLDTERIDDWVSKSKLTLTWKGKRAGLYTIEKVLCQCGDYSTEFDLGKIELIQLKNATATKSDIVLERPSIALPLLVNITQNEVGIKVQYREQGVLIKTGSVLLTDLPSK
jgi:hypothetical protein